MKNSKINQELENIINLMGEDVSFEFQDKYHSQKIQLTPLESKFHYS